MTSTSIKPMTVKSKLAKCKHYLPEKEVRYRGNYYGKCKCGQHLEFTNNGMHCGWFTVDDEMIIKTIEANL